MSDILTIIIDTREQGPFFGIPSDDYITVQRKLDTGDYSIKGFEHLITIERKEVSDFVGSLTHERERFERELERMVPMERKYLVVEATWGMIEGFAKHGRKKTDKGFRTVRPLKKGRTFNVPSKALFQSVVALTLKYGVIPFFARDRAEAELFTLSVLEKYYKYKREGQK